MNNLKLLATVALLLAYVAGMVTGWAGSTLAGDPPPHPESGGSWLSHTLQLTEEQQAQMEAIWAPEAPDKEGDDPRSKSKALYEARNLEVRALLTEEQQTAFDDIYRKFEEKREALSEARRVRHEAAIEKTMAILTPDQQEEYKGIVEKFERRPPGRMHGPRKWSPDKKKESTE